MSRDQSFDEYDDQEEEHQRKNKEQKKEKHYELTVRLFPRRKDAGPVFIDFSPDESELAAKIDRYLYDLKRERRFPDLGECSNICRMFGVRARATQAGVYRGHLFEDGQVDKEIEKALH